jgi:restriction endonuclease Mrr
MVITTSHFTKSAQEEARRPDRPTVRLIDGQEFAHVLALHKVGIKTTSVALPRLDALSLRDALATGDA